MGEDVSTAWHVRLAEPHEHADARRLAPALFTAARAPHRLHVAFDQGTKTLAGVGALAWHSFATPPGFPCWVVVAETARRRGCARALLEAVLRDCAGEAARVHAWDALTPDAPGSRFAEAVGATVRRRVLYFVADAARFLAMIAPIVARLRDRGAIPAGARIVSLAAAPPRDVAGLVSSTFGNRYDAALAAARHDGPGGYDREGSVVLMQQNDVRGALLYRWSDGIPVIDVNVVAPALRRGWANALLLEHATRNGMAQGATRFAFHCDDDVRDTVNLARRAHAATTRVSVEWTLPVPPPTR